MVWRMSTTYLPWPDLWGCPHPAHSPEPHFIPLGPSVSAQVMPQQCCPPAPHSSSHELHWSGLWLTQTLTSDPPHHHGSTCGSLGPHPDPDFLASRLLTCPVTTHSSDDLSSGLKLAATSGSALLAVVGQALPTGSLPSWPWHCTQLSALPPLGSSQPLLHPDVKGREVFN